MEKAKLAVAFVLLTVFSVSAVFAFQSAVFFEPFDRIGVEYFAPDVGVITGRVTAGERVRKIKASVTRRHRRKIDTGLVQCLRLKGDCVLRNIRWIQLMPCLIEK